MTAEKLTILTRYLYDLRSSLALGSVVEIVFFRIPFDSRILDIMFPQRANHHRPRRWSSVLVVNDGVPQGSMLAPNLFFRLITNSSTPTSNLHCFDVGVTFHCSLSYFTIRRATTVIDHERAVLNASLPISDESPWGSANLICFNPFETPLLSISFKHLPRSS